MEFKRDLNDHNLSELQTLIDYVYGLRQSQRKFPINLSLKELGQAIYQLTIPEELQELLERNKAPLSIYGGDPLFPWEVLHNGEEFLGMRFAIGRLPSWFESGKSRDSDEVHRVGGERLQLVLCADPMDNFPKAKREIDFLVDSLPTRRPRTYLQGSDFSLEQLIPLMHLADDSSGIIWHVAARANFGLGEGANIPLQNNMLSLSSLHLSSPRRTWVFLHLEQIAEYSNNPAATVISFASGLLEKGVQGVTVAMRPSFTHSGRQMVGTYYQLLMDGIPPAQALSESRQLFISRNPEDPAWSSFVFFGDPNAHLFRLPNQQFEQSSQLSLEPAAASNNFATAASDVSISTSSVKAEPSPKATKSVTPEDGTLGYHFEIEQAIGIALMEAKTLRQDFIGTPHLFIGLTKCPGGLTRELLDVSGFEPKKVRDTIRFALGFGHAPGNAKILPTQRCARALKAAEVNARKENDDKVGEKHLLAAILQSGEGLAYEVLKKMGADPVKLLDKLMRGVVQPANNRMDSDIPTILRYGRDLTKLAQRGKLPPLTGRYEELMRLAQILLRRFKNNPLIIGDAGVGKTALVEGLAQRIHAGAVPEELRDRHLIELSLSSLVAGTRYRGDFEERLTQVIQEAAEHPEVILFLDEFHTIVGAGETHQGTLDAANILKPALARGELRCIGATTPTEYRKSIEKDAALERRFHPLFLEEPSSEESLEILRDARAGYEEHHKVAIPNELLDLAVKLSVRYLPDRRLPDKALDLIDEACALVTLRGYSNSAMLTPDGKIRTLNACPVVSTQAIYKVLADWTGIPVGELSREESQRLLDLEQLLNAHVLGQPLAVHTVSQAIQLGRAGLKRENRPTAVMLFIGPSGVGKTELSRVLAKELFGNESALIRLDMSEFAEKHSSAKMLGAPPGYVGYGEDGQLLAQLHNKPYSVVLLDEIEKAHADVLDLFLQLFEEGRITDALGRTIDGRHAVFILTSNIFGQRFWRNNRTMGFQTNDASVPQKSEIERELLNFFRPEFLNRIDDIVLFDPLNEDSLYQIARIHFAELLENALQHNVALNCEEEVLRHLAKTSVDPAMGARPLLRQIEHHVTRPLSQMIISTHSNKTPTDKLRVQFCLSEGVPQLRIIDSEQCKDSPIGRLYHHK